MKNILKATLLLLMGILFFTSCRTDQYEIGSKTKQNERSSNSDLNISVASLRGDTTIGGDEGPCIWSGIDNPTNCDEYDGIYVYGFGQHHCPETLFQWTIYREGNPTPVLGPVVTSSPRMPLFEVSNPCEQNTFRVTAVQVNENGDTCCTILGGGIFNTPLDLSCCPATCQDIFIERDLHVCFDSETGEYYPIKNSNLDLPGIVSSRDEQIKLINDGITLKIFDRGEEDELWEYLFDLFLQTGDVYTIRYELEGGDECEAFIDFNIIVYSGDDCNEPCNDTEEQIELFYCNNHEVSGWIANYYDIVTPIDDENADNSGVKIWIDGTLRLEINDLNTITSLWIENLIIQEMGSGGIVTLEIEYQLENGCTHTIKYTITENQSWCD